MSSGRQMTLIEHLAELRSRLIRSMIALALCTFVSFGLFYDVMKDIIGGPLDALDPNTANVFARFSPVVDRLRPYIVKEQVTVNVDLHAITLMEVFTVKFKVAILCGIILSCPYVLYQAWAFIGAGLTRRERRAMWRYLPLSVILFLLGVLFAYFVAIPIAVLFLLTVDPAIKRVLTYGPYFSTVLRVVVAFGAAFQLPLVAMALASLEIVSAEAMAKGRRYAIVLMFVVGALLTPPEPFSQCLLAAPLILLYEFGLLLARVAERGKARDAAGQGRT